MGWCIVDSKWYTDISSGESKSFKCHICRKKRHVRAGTIAAPVITDGATMIIEVYWILCQQCHNNGWEPHALVYNKNYEYKISNLYRNHKTGELTEFLHGI